MDELVDIVARYWLQFICSVLSAMLIKAYNMIRGQLKEFSVQQEAIKSSVASLLKEKISRSHTYWTQKGYCPISALEDIELMYNQLKELGHYKTYDNLIEELKRMRHYSPDKDDFDGGDLGDY